MYEAILPCRSITTLVAKTPGITARARSVSLFLGMARSGCTVTLSPSMANGKRLKYIKQKYRFDCVHAKLPT